MPIAQIENPGQVGIITDIRAENLPNNAFTSGINVRFSKQAIKKIEGHARVFGTASIVPYWLMPVQTPSVAYWIYAGLTKVYVTDGSAHFNITRQSGGVDDNYAATENLNWTGGVIGGIDLHRIVAAALEPVNVLV